MGCLRRAASPGNGALAGGGGRMAFHSRQMGGAQGLQVSRRDVRGDARLDTEHPAAPPGVVVSCAPSRAGLTSVLEPAVASLLQLRLLSLLQPLHLHLHLHLHLLFLSWVRECQEGPGAPHDGTDVVSSPGRPLQLGPGTRAARDEDGRRRSLLVFRGEGKGWEKGQTCAEGETEVRRDPSVMGGPPVDSPASRRCWLCCAGGDVMRGQGQQQIPFLLSGG
jgi:hypothetical protein